MKTIAISFAFATGLLISSCRTSNHFNRFQLVKVGKHVNGAPVKNKETVHQEDGIIASSPTGSEEVVYASEIEGIAEETTEDTDWDEKEISIEKKIKRTLFGFTERTVKHPFHLTIDKEENPKPPTVMKSSSVGWATFGLILLLIAGFFSLLLLGTFVGIGSPGTGLLIAIIAAIVIFSYLILVGFIRLLLHVYRRQGQDTMEDTKAAHRRAFRLGEK